MKENININIKNDELKNEKEQIKMQSKSYIFYFFTLVYMNNHNINEIKFYDENHKEIKVKFFQYSEESEYFTEKIIN